MAKKSALKILIAYEDLDAGVRAKKISERVAAELNLSFNFHSDLYKFDFLSHPQLREEASLQASTADLVIISTKDDGLLPGHVKSWMEEWLPVRGKGQAALVALLGDEEADTWATNATREYLQQMAERGQMDFFCKADLTAQAPQPPQSPQPVRLARPAPPQVEYDVPMYSDTYADSRWQGWGIND